MPPPGLAVAYAGQAQVARRPVRAAFSILKPRIARTRTRPFVTGELSGGRGWLGAAAALLAFATALAAVLLNGMVALQVFLGAATYAFVYTSWLKRRTWLNIVVGGLAGSFAVLAGVATVTPRLSSSGWALATSPACGSA